MCGLIGRKPSAPSSQRGGILDSPAQEDSAKTAAVVDMKRLITSFPFFKVALRLSA
jgi:hypothetical protein